MAANGWWVPETASCGMPVPPPAGAAGADPATGFRLRAAGRGHEEPELGRIRPAVERCHDVFARFGRVARRWDRSARRFLGWVRLAACIIFIRSGFLMRPCVGSIDLRGLRRFLFEDGLAP
jgi:hypothetical protein